MTITSTPIATQRPLKGILLVVLATLVFAMADVLTKHLASLYAIALVVAGRYLVNLGLLAAFLGPAQGKRLWRTNRTVLVVGRGLALAAASLTMGLALRLMPVGETVAIIYIAPFLVLALSQPLLGEKAARADWIGAAFGFAGVLMIVRPGSGLDPLGVALALVNAGCATAYHLLTRILTRTETNSALMFHTALTGAVVFCALLAWSGSSGSGIGTLPGPIDIALIAALGLLATLGHYLFTAAYREAPATQLAPINYLHLVWAGLFGWLFFAHVPDLVTLAGMALVAGAGAAVALRARPKRRLPLLEGEIE
jgi:drug/metabolite transporter (DMT)-like permease